MNRKALLLFFVSCSFCFADELAPKKVLISQFVEHPALDKTTQGIIDALETEGYVRGKNLDLRVESAQANAALAAQIANKFFYGDSNAVVGVGTISAQSFAKWAKEGRINLLFSSVTDPLSAGLVDSLEHPGNHTSGVSNFVPLEPQLTLFKELQPSLARLGILYNPGEGNSVSIVKKLEKIAPDFGLTVVKQTVSKTADVSQAAIKLASQADAIFISNDNTALSALLVVIRAASAVGIPVYVSDTDAVEKGALAALGPNQYEVGVQTGKMAAKVLRGEDPGAIPVEFPDKTELYINMAAAKTTKITVSSEIVEKAAKVFPESLP